MPAAPAFLRHPLDAARLRDLRSRAGLSQEILAYRSSLSLRTIRVAEAEGIASTRTVRAIAGVLRVDPAELAPPSASSLPLPPSASAVSTR